MSTSASPAETIMAASWPTPAAGPDVHGRAPEPEPVLGALLRAVDEEPAQAAGHAARIRRSGEGSGPAVGCPAVDHLEHAAALEDDARRLVDLVAGADPATPVPTCPGWTLADLVDHVGTLYRWSSAHVATSARQRLSPAALEMGRPEAGATAGWLGAGVAPMLATFRSCDPDARVWGWGADRHARFWPRRMLFETVVHRADAAIALGDRRRHRPRRGRRRPGRAARATSRTPPTSPRASASCGATTSAWPCSLPMPGCAG